MIQRINLYTFNGYYFIFWKKYFTENLVDIIF